MACDGVAAIWEVGAPVALVVVLMSPGLQLRRDEAVVNQGLFFERTLHKVEITITCGRGCARWCLRVLRRRFSETWRRREVLRAHPERDHFKDLLALLYARPPTYHCMTTWCLLARELLYTQQTKLLMCCHA